MHKWGHECNASTRITSGPVTLGFMSSRGGDALYMVNYTNYYEARRCALRVVEVN